ncbi:MAG: hypothetical protein HYR70_13315 [Chloroflexi bacterium]|nr:hypothetical protein [Chloroflexota bacterium]MBI3339610.1 hypothetical protein [Chloroflexota bacterium]
MDPATIAAAAASILFPYLAKAGKLVIEDVSKQLPDMAGKLWDKISQKFQDKPAAQDAAKDLASQADDKDNQSAFETQLRKMLKDDPTFLEELSSLVEKAQKESISLQGSGAIATHGGVAAGQGGVAVQGNVNGNIVVGSNNSINSDRKKNNP